MPKSQFARTATLLACSLFLAACEHLPALNNTTSPAASCPPATVAASEAAKSSTACPACPRCPSEAVPPIVAAKPLQAAHWNDLPGWQDDDASAAWPAFLHSCRALNGKNGNAWKRVCDLGKQLKNPDSAAVRDFFERHFTPYAVVAADGKNEGMITGYYEPLLKGSRKHSKARPYPVLGVPDDLITVELAEVSPETRHLRLRGRLQGNKLVPYWSRADIENDLQAGRERWRDKTLLWVDDAIELFFLQIQGSGRVRLPDGSLVRLGYADQNGHPYQSIGKALLDRGELKPGEASMQGIQAWARANPSKLQALLNVNPSYVFFRELPASDDGPLGAQGVPLTGERSLAIDPRFIPLGAPVFLATTLPNSKETLQRLMLAQDTGGAIRGAPRADFFWGFGPRAGELAGRMKQSGKMWVLLPPEAAPR